MRRHLYLFLLFFAFITVRASDGNNKQEIIRIKSVKFALPLIEQWISGYAKVNPDARIVIADKDETSEKIDIQLFISDVQKDSLHSNHFYSSVGRYAILPFAVHFGYESSNLKGKKISGDDIYLINAVQKDNTGVSFNNLNYIFDLNSRQLKKEIAILPLDLKKEYSEVLAESNLDKLIDLLEDEGIELIPVKEIGFVFQNQVNPEVKKFLQWILSEGQTYNHQFGFLNLDTKTLNHQKEQVKTRLLTYN